MMYYGSVAPVVVKDKLILGPSGDDLDVPAYLDARSPENGDLIWRWYVTPQKEGDPGLDTWPNLDMAKHGGGMTWQPVTYDPELNLIYVTTGNPQPVVAFKNREGANLFTASIVALERRHREDGVVLPVLAARHARLGRDADGGPLRRHDQRPAAQAARAGLAQRPVLRPRSHQRQGRRLDRVHQDELVRSATTRRASRCRIRRSGRRSPARWSRRTRAARPTGIRRASARRPACSTSTPTRAFSVWYIYDASDNPMGWGGTDRGGYAEQPQLKAIDYKTGKIRWSIPRYGGNSGLLTHRRQRAVQRRPPAASAPTTRRPASRCGTRASAARSPTVRSPTSSTACSTSSPGPGSRLVAFVLNQ